MNDYAKTVERLANEAAELAKHGSAAAAQEEKDKVEGRIRGRDFALRLCWENVRVLSQDGGLNIKYRERFHEKCSVLFTGKSTAFALAFRKSLTETCLQLVADVGAKMSLPVRRKPIKARAHKV